MAQLCPTCQTENSPEAKKCSSCGGRMPRRRGSKNSDAVQIYASNLGNDFASTAFKFAAYGLVPGLGLILGPIAVVLSLVAYRREKAGPPRKGRSPALGVLTLAVAEALTNWAGAALMVYGLMSAAH